MSIQSRLSRWMGIGLAVLVLSGQSCVSHRELVTLNEDEIVAETLRSDTLIRQVGKTPDFEPYRIRPFDQLMIRINAFDGTTEDFLNREFGRNAVFSQNIGFDPESIYFNSYGVNDSGYVFLPILESVKVDGMTIAEVKAMLDEAYSPYLKFASTNVKLGNMRVTVLGEVNRPGIQYLYNDQNTLLETIGLAGDFTNFSNRRKVKIIRRTDQGAKTAYLNLKRSDFMDTEYYYVRPYDVIYVEPIKAKSFDVSAETLGVVFSAISLAALITNIIIDSARRR